MTIERDDHAREKGIALAYVGVFLVPLLLCTGLAIDLGRGYLVRVSLAKAVDAAALAAARNIAQGTDAAESAAKMIFNANFPEGFFGVTYVQQPPEGMKIDVDDSSGAYIINVASYATLPTTFMRIAKFDTLTVAAAATATRRLVDMSFAMDRSGSLLSVFPAVQAAAETFVSYFDKDSDRVALITFSSGTTVEDRMRSPERGFDPDSIKSHIGDANFAGPTATAEALYQAWDELRTVPPGRRSGLRIVVLFTDGSPNAFSAEFPKVAISRSTCSSPTDSTSLRQSVIGTICAIDYSPTGNFVGPTTWYPPYTVGLYKTYWPSVLPAVLPTVIHTPIDSSSYVFPYPPVDPLTPNKCIPYLPLTSYHYRHFSPNILSQFNLYDPDPTLRQRPLTGPLTADGYPDHPQNAYNAARNLAETIANEIRKDGIRIYTLGLGDLLNQPLGQFKETGSSILQRIANDPASDTHNPSQPDGRYFFANTTAGLNAAFEAVHDEVFRLTQ